VYIPTLFLPRPCVPPSPLWQPLVRMSAAETPAAKRQRTDPCAGPSLSPAGFAAVVRPAAAAAATAITVSDGTDYTWSCPRELLALLPRANFLTAASQGLGPHEALDLSQTALRGLNRVVEAEVLNYGPNLGRGLRRWLACILLAARAGQALNKGLLPIPPYVAEVPALVLQNVAEPPAPQAAWQDRLRCLQYLGLQDAFFLALTEPLQELWEFRRYAQAGLKVLLVGRRERPPFSLWWRQPNDSVGAYLSLAEAERARWAASGDSLAAALPLAGAGPDDQPLPALLALAQKFDAFARAEAEARERGASSAPLGAQVDTLRAEFRECLAAASFFAAELLARAGPPGAAAASAPGARGLDE